MRTSFSPVIYEVLDFAAALYDRDVSLLAQAPTLPVFMGTMSFCVEAAVEAVGGEEALEPGDIILYNVPYGTGSHPQDAATVMPVFVGRRARRLRRDQGALARHRRQGPLLDRHDRRVPGGHHLPGRQAVLARARSCRTSSAWRRPTRASRRWSPATSTRSWSACAPGPRRSRASSSGTARSCSAPAWPGCTTTARRSCASGSTSCPTAATSGTGRWTPTASTTTRSRSTSCSRSAARRSGSTTPAHRRSRPARSTARSRPRCRPAASR